MRWNLLVLADKTRIQSRLDLRCSALTSSDPRLTVTTQAHQFALTKLENVFELLKCHDLEITIDDLVENRVVTEEGIRVSEDTDSNKQRTATTGQVIRSMLGDDVVAFVPPDCNEWFLYSIFRDPFIAACIVGYGRYWSRWTAYSWNVGSVSYLNSHMPVSPCFFVFIRN